MFRIVTAVAMMALLGTPALAQYAPGGGSPPSGSQSMQRSDQPGSLGQQNPSTSQTPGNAPADCTPSDVRPECQTAQIPANPLDPQNQQNKSGSSGSPGGSSSGSDSSPGSSSSPDR